MGKTSSKLEACISELADITRGHTLSQGRWTLAYSTCWPHWIESTSVYFQSPCELYFIGCYLTHLWLKRCAAQVEDRSTGPRRLKYFWRAKLSHWGIIMTKHYRKPHRTAIERNCCIWPQIQTKPMAFESPHTICILIHWFWSPLALFTCPVNGSIW